MGNKLSQEKLLATRGDTSGQLHVEIIRSNLTGLIERMDTFHCPLYEKLLEKRVLTRDEVKQIKDSSPAEWQQKSNLLSLLEEKSEEEFGRFKEALTETNQGFLIEELLDKPGEINTERGRHSLAQHYNRSLDEIPVYPLTDNPTMAKLRRVYTRTDLCLAPGWPPQQSRVKFQDYSKIFLATADAPVPKRVLLLGSPGTGKSMLSQMVALHWADNVNGKTQRDTIDRDSHPSPDEAELMQHLSILLHIDLGRITSKISLCQVIAEQIVMRNMHDIPALIEYIKQNQEKCCIILDGWDEYDPSCCPELTQICNGRLWPDANVIITSRIREQTVLPRNIDRQCLLMGFNKQQIVKYITNMLPYDEVHRSSSRDICLFVKEHKLWEVFTIPLMLNFLCTLYMSGAKLEDKVTLLLTSIIQSTIGKELLKESGQEASEAANIALETTNEELMALGKLALSGLTGKTTKTSFSKHEVLETVGYSGRKLGLLHMMKTQDATGSVLYQFSHKSIQEYLSAIYVSNSAEGFELFLQYLDSLIKMYDQQLHVMFICGLNNGYGQILIDKIQEISKSSTATAAECPGFRWPWLGWRFENHRSSVDVARRKTCKANDTSPFVINCCWEMSNQNRKESSFPFVKTCSFTTVQIEPKFNFRELPLSRIVDLAGLGYISLRSNNILAFCNLHITQDNVQQVSELFRHCSGNEVAKRVELVNIWCDRDCQILFELIQHFKHVLCFVMNDVKMDKFCMLQLLQHLSTWTGLERLLLETVYLHGCQEILVKALTQLTSLQSLAFHHMALPGCEKKLSAVISELHQLEVLGLYDTDMSPAGEAFPCSLQNHRKLKCLNLSHSQLTKDQISHVVKILPSCDNLVEVDIPMYNAAHQLPQSLSQLTMLTKLVIGDNHLNSNELPFSIWFNLPPSIQVIKMYFAHENDALQSVRNYIDTLAEALPSLPNLQCVILDFLSVNIKQFVLLCQEQEVRLVQSDEEFTQLIECLAKIESSLQNQYPHEKTTD